MSIARDTAGLVVEDDFDRANSTTLGGDWNERAGDWAIAENELGITAGGGAYHVDNDAETMGEMFVQADMRVSHEDSSVAIWARFTWNGGSDSGYLLFLVPASDVIRIQNRNNGSFGANVDESKTLTIDISYPAQFYVANAVQEGWVDGTTVIATQTVHDDENTRVAGFRVGHAGSSRTTRCDDFIWCRSKNIVVTGLSSGWKAKVRNSGGAVVAEATESGGTATIDASRFGGATEIVPIGGWTDLIVTDSGDTIQETYNATTVYPGDEYTFSGTLTLVVEDLTVGSSFDEPALVQANTIAPEDMAVASALDAPTLQVAALEPEDMTVACVLDGALALIQAHVIAPEDLAVASIIEAPTLVLAVLAPEGLTVASTLEGNLALVQANVLAPEDMAVASVLDSPTLTLGEVVLVVEDMTVSSVLVEPTLVLTFLLSPEDLTVASTLGEPTILQNALDVEGLTVAARLDTIIFVFTTEGVLIINGVAVTPIEFVPGWRDMDHQQRGADFRMHAAVHQLANQTADSTAKRFSARFTLDAMPTAESEAFIATHFEQPLITVGGDLPGGQYLCVITEPPNVPIQDGDGHNEFITVAVEAVEGYEVGA